MVLHLENVNSFGYLGVVFSSFGIWFEAQATLANQAVTAELSFRRYLYHLYDLPPKVARGIFERLVAPILMYGSEVWGFHTADAVERVHTKYCKKILHLKCATCISFRYVELGRYPLKLERYFRII